MEAIFEMFKRFIVGDSGNSVPVTRIGYKRTFACPYYVQIDEAAWKEFSEKNEGSTLNDFIATYGVKKILCNNQNIPHDFIGVERGAAIKLRL